MLHGAVLIISFVPENILLSTHDPVVVRALKRLLRFVVCVQLRWRFHGLHCISVHARTKLSAVI